MLTAMARICFANYTDTLGDIQANGRDGGEPVFYSLQRSCVPGVTGTRYVFDVYDPLNLLAIRYLARGMTSQ